MAIQLKADTARMWELATKATYESKEYGTLSIREMLQNSIDAIRKMQEKDPSYEGRIGIALLDDTIVFTDNGIGMDAKTLEDKFLTLGGTTKGEGEVGGFGIAKAVILGCAESWNISTNKIQFSSDMLGIYEAFPPADEEIQGTVITLDGVRNAYWQLQSALNYFVKTSLIPENITITFEGKEIERLLQDGQEKGFEGEGYQSPEGIQYRVTIHPREDSGDAYIRLNGLTQFKQWLFSSPKFDLVLDIFTDIRPGSEEYPFVTSREGLRGKMLEIWIKVKQTFEENPISATKEWEIQVFRNDEMEKTLKRIEGRYNYYPFYRSVSQIQAKHEVSRFSEKSPEELAQEEREREEAERIYHEEMRLQLDILWAIKKSGNLQLNLEELTLRNFKLIVIWDSLLQIVAKLNDIDASQWHPGLVFDNEITTDILKEGYDKFALFNPMILSDIRGNSTSAILMVLLDMTCHVLAHIAESSGSYISSSHGEVFLTRKEKLFKNCALHYQDFYDLVIQLKKKDMVAAK